MKKKGISKIINRMIAGFLVLVMSVALGGTYPAETLITETHELPVAMSDGKYDGEGSSYAIENDGTYEVNDKKRSINILEIVPDERKGIIGYTIGGCEPISQADLDALVNQYPGPVDQWNPDSDVWRPKIPTKTSYGDVGITDLDMNMGDQAAMYYYADTMNGYYEDVGDGNGVYALKEVPDQSDTRRVNGEYIINVDMVSKYAENKSGSYKTGYKYVWVEDETINQKTKRSDLVTGTNIGDKIYVYNHRKNKYINNEFFLTVFSDFCPGTVSTKGIYINGGVNGMPSKKSQLTKTENYALVQEWKEHNAVTVLTKEPTQVTCADIDNADFIIILRGEADGSYIKGFGINAYVMGNENAPKTFSESNDLSVDVIKRIYKHVVVDEDVMIAYSHETATGHKQFNTNIGKLAAMLFYMNNTKANEGLSPGESEVGTGRDFFKNLLLDYGPVAGGIERDINNSIDEIGNDKIPSTDYLYIGKKNDSDSDDLNVHINGNIRHWDIDAGNDYFGVQPFRDDWLYNDELKNHYYTVEGGLGFYAIDTKIEGRYRNQLFFMESDNIYKYLDNPPTWNKCTARDLHAISTNTKHKEHYIDSENKTAKKYFLSMNIVNGDSVTPEKKGVTENDINKNKTLYINKYEIEKGSLESLPIRIKMVTSHPIKSIVVKKKDGTLIATYSKPAGILGDGDLGGLPITDDTEYTDGKAPYIAEKDYYKYSLSATIDLDKEYYSHGANNTIIVEASIEPTEGQIGKVSDMITIVTRDFFMLN